jgi:hypothetical protein
VLRLSESGNVIETVRTEPRLVPSQSVGTSAEGSAVERRREKNVNVRCQHCNLFSDYNDDASLVTRAIFIMCINLSACLPLFFV